MAPFVTRLHAAQAEAASYLSSAAERVLRRPPFPRALETAERVDGGSIETFARDVDYAIFLDQLRTHVGEMPFQASVRYLVLEEHPVDIARLCLTKPPRGEDAARIAVEAECQAVLWFAAGILKGRAVRASA